MLVVVTYDVNTATEAGAARLRRVAKLCERYGRRVQNSVFEVLLDAAQLTALKAQLAATIDAEHDSFASIALATVTRSALMCLVALRALKLENC